MTAVVQDKDLDLAMSSANGSVARHQAWCRYEGRRWMIFLASHKHIAENSLTDEERWNIRIFRR